MRHVRAQIVPSILIPLVSLAAAVALTWLAPSLSAATVNMLFRLRGTLRPPADVVIVAIDDPSLQQVGNWPWPRSVMASVLDRITAAQPRAVGLDVIYAETSNEADDQLLTAAVRRNGRVVLPAQLTDIEAGRSDLPAPPAWLMPLPEIRRAAAATGHAHADPDVDGVLRSMQLSKADARGERLWAFGLETLRVAEQIPPGEVEERKGALRVGRYEVTVHDEAEVSQLPGVTVIRPNEMFVNYLGPARTFPYYSIADVLGGRVPAAAFADRIILVGAVAQTMGDTRITPFISYGGGERQGGTGMPGVEVHANVIETIRRGAWLRPLPDWLSFALALLVILGAAAVVRLADGWRVVAGLSALLLLIVLGSFYVFNHHYVIPPLVPTLAAFFSVVPLLLLNNSITASRDLDRKLVNLARIQRRFMAHDKARAELSAPLAFFGALMRAETVALYQQASGGHALRLNAYVGRKPAEHETWAGSDAAETVAADSSHTLRVPLRDEAGPVGLLLVERAGGASFSAAELKLAREFAAGLAAELTATRRAQTRSLPLSLPHNVNWKLRAVDEITAHLGARIGFMNRVFTSMTEGLLVADITGRVVFANPGACRFWAALDPSTLNRSSLTELFGAHGIIAPDELSETMRVVLGGRNVLLEVERSGGDGGRFYTLQFSAVVAHDNQTSDLRPRVDGLSAPAPESPGIIGLIVIITDVTKRRELERVRAETLQLVSHELRAPLTSIQGLSDLLLKFPVPADETQELLATIYSEAVRMNELIGRYLDVTSIESGAQSLTRTHVVANNLIAECVRAHKRLAAEKGVRVTPRLAEPSPVLSADAPLLTQAVNNLLSNAIKYSPPAAEVEISATGDDGHACIYVRDHGYGIPRAEHGRVFEKFYRLARDAESDTVGSGLGLPLVKEIVERHGGWVTLESEPGVGSTFTICLPAAKG